MIIIDRDRCGYCGGCIAVCPVGTIELAETRLEADIAVDPALDCLTTLAAAR